MKQFEDLLNKRNAEIDAEEKAKRNNQVNLEKSVGYGILYAAIGGVLAFIAAEIAFWIITAVWYIVYIIFIGGAGTQTVPDLKWKNIFIILVTLVGIGIGWFGGYSGNRERKK